MEEDYLKNYFDNIPCGYCGQHCHKDNIELVERAGDHWVLSVYCDACKKQGFISAVVRNGEESGADPELTEEEIKRFSTPVSLDDLSDMYNFLKDFEGDFSELFPDLKPADNGNPQAEPPTEP